MLPYQVWIRTSTDGKLRVKCHSMGMIFFFNFKYWYRRGISMKNWKFLWWCFVSYNVFINAETMKNVLWYRILWLFIRTQLDSNMLIYEMRFIFKDPIEQYVTVLIERMSGNDCTLSVCTLHLHTPIDGVLASQIEITANFNSRFIIIIDLHSMDNSSETDLLKYIYNGWMCMYAMHVFEINNIHWYTKYSLNK